MLLCTVLTFAMCADPGVDGAITVGDLTVPIVWSRAAVSSCVDLGAQSTQDGAGETRLETAWQTSQTRERGEDGYTGHLVVRVADARIELTAYTWDHMTPAGAECRCAASIAPRSGTRSVTCARCWRRSMRSTPNASVQRRRLAECANTRRLAKERLGNAAVGCA